jgi:methionine-rich copper-binding protein CopC
MLTHVLAAATLASGLFLGALTSAGPAWAHAARIAGDPADNAELAQSPPRVSATFNEEMQPEFAAMTVVGPDGGQWGQGTPTVDGAVISVGVRGGAPAGTYTVNYRATSADGHVVTGSWSYRVTPAAATGTGAPVSSPVAAPEPPAAPSSPSGGLPAWPFAVAAVAVVAAGAVWAVRRRS